MSSSLSATFASSPYSMSFLWSCVFSLRSIPPSWSVSPCTAMLLSVKSLLHSLDCQHSNSWRCDVFVVTLSCQFYGNFNTFKILSTVKNSHWMNLSTFAVLSLWPLKEVSLVVKVCTWITLFNCQISSAKLLLGQSGNFLLFLAGSLLSIVLNEAN